MDLLILKVSTGPCLTYDWGCGYTRPRAWMWQPRVKTTAWGSVSGIARNRNFGLCLIVRFLSVLCNELLTNAGADWCKLSDWWRLITDLEPLWSAVLPFVLSMCQKLWVSWMLSTCVPAEWLHSCFSLGDHTWILALCWIRYLVLYGKKLFLM